MMYFWGDRGHCPKCGRFCGDIGAIANSEGLISVDGICKKHGTVDLTNQEWSWDEFFGSESDPAHERSLREEKP